MNTHWLKTLPEFYDDVATGRKPFEVRIDDRFPRYEVGDALILAEWDDNERKYTGRDCEKEVTYTLRDPRFVLDGYVIIGIRQKDTPIE